VMLLSRRGMDVHLVLRFLMYREIKTCLYYCVCVLHRAPSTGSREPVPGTRYPVASTSTSTITFTFTCTASTGHLHSSKNNMHTFVQVEEYTCIILSIF